MLIEFPGKVRVSVGTPLGEPHYPRLDQIESGEQPFHLGAGARGGWDGYLFAQFTCSFPLLGAALHGPVGDGQEAAGGEAVAKPGDDSARVVGVGDEMQDRQEEQRYGLVQVE